MYIWFYGERLIIIYNYFKFVKFIKLKDESVNFNV